MEKFLLPLRGYLLIIIEYLLRHGRPETTSVAVTGRTFRSVAVTRDATQLQPQGRHTTSTAMKIRTYETGMCPRCRAAVYVQQQKPPDLFADVARFSVHHL